jgi:EGF-like domain
MRPHAGALVPRLLCTGTLSIRRTSLLLCLIRCCADPCAGHYPCCLSHGRGTPSAICHAPGWALRCDSTSCLAITATIFFDLDLFRRRRYSGSRRRQVSGPADCRGRGRCDYDAGRCRCSAGWTGPDCGERQPRPCAAHGPDGSVVHSIWQRRYDNFCVGVCDDNVGHCASLHPLSRPVKWYASSRTSAVHGA